MATEAVKQMKAEAQIELGAIYEISKILSSSLDLQVTLREVLGVLSAHLKMRRGTVSLVQDDGHLRVVGASGLSTDEIERGQYQSGEGITGRIMKTGSPIVVPDVANEPLFLNRTRSRRLVDGQVVAFVGAPIKVGRKVIGVITIDREMNSAPVNFEFPRDFQHRAWLPARRDSG